MLLFICKTLIFYKSHGFNLFIFPILSVLVIWPRIDNNVFGKVKLDFASFLFQQSQIKTWSCNLLKWKYRTYTIIVFSKFHFISFLSLVKQYSFEGDFEFFCSHAPLSGDSKMRNTGCPKNRCILLFCKIVYTLCRSLQ